MRFDLELTAIIDRIIKEALSKSATAYTYDANGNIITDPSRGITMTMNHLNKVNRITKDANNYIDYYYDANGLLHRKKIVENGVVLETRDYLRGVELKDSIVDMVHFSEGFLKYRSGLSYSSSLNLTSTETSDKMYLAGKVTSTSDITNQADVTYLAEDSIMMNGGFEVENNTEFAAVIDSSAQGFEDWEVYYTIRDHLGNTRMVVSDMNLDGGIDTSEILQVSDYYPFGAEHSTSLTGDYAYRYNGKEKELGLDLGLLRYGARDMDPWTARFRGVDPISDQFPHVSPYNYAENAPISNIDLWGLQKVSIHVRSFAPFDKFGHAPPFFGPFAGDGANRGFSTSDNVTSRISGNINIKMKPEGTEILSAFGGESRSISLASGTRKDSETQISSGLSYGAGMNDEIISNLSFSIFGNNKVVPISPDINVNSFFQISSEEFDNGSEAIIKGLVTGDGFPNNEVFMRDQSGQSIFLSTFATQAGANSGPALSLFGNSNRQKDLIPSTKVRFDQNGNILNVSSEGKIYSIQAWNSRFTQNNPQ